MQGEEIDNMDELIKAASESYHPAYDDKAWDKMEVLLNKHLPQKEDRRRPVALILLLLLTVGGAFYALNYSWNKKTGKPETDLKTLPFAGQSKKQALAAKDDVKILPGLQDNNLVQNTTLQKSNKNHDPADLNASTRVTRLKGKKGITSSAADITTDLDVTDNVDPVLSKGISAGQEISSQNADKLFPPASINIVTAQPGTPVAISPQGSVAANNIDKPVAIQSTVVEKPAAKKAIKTKTAKGFRNNFALTLSAGPDISFVGLGNPGKTKLSYGVGVNYTFAKRFTVKSGFYKATKIYSAEPADYHPPTGYWTYYTNLQRVDADCNVYEIPLTLAYNFGQSKNHNWFAAVGLSSYLMKKETYNYLYKNQWGQSMYKGWTLHNKNKHYFSVVTLSGGYQYKLSQRVSLAAEPYLKIPLHGVGFGKIKLNSGGLLVTASIKPFAKTE